MKKTVIFLICLALCLPCISVNAADGFRYYKLNNQFGVKTTNTEYDSHGYFFIIAKYKQDDDIQSCEIIALQKVKFTDGEFVCGEYTIEEGYDYKYMVFDGVKPLLTRAVTINIDSPDGDENTGSSTGTPRV